MLTNTVSIIANFTVPADIGTTALGLLWLLPIVTAVAVVYKAAKLPKIKTANFIKETVLLFGSIIVFLAVTALALCLIARFIIE